MVRLRLGTQGFAFSGSGFKGLSLGMAFGLKVQGLRLGRARSLAASSTRNVPRIPTVQAPRPWY